MCCRDEAAVGRSHLAADRRQDAKAVGVFGHPLALGDRIACGHGRYAAVNQLQPDDGGQRRVLYRQHDILSSGFERQSADEGQSQADPSFPKRVWEWSPGAERRPARAAGAGQGRLFGSGIGIRGSMPCFMPFYALFLFSAAGAAKHAETNSVKTAAPQVLRGVLLSVFTIIVYP